MTAALALLESYKQCSTIDIVVPLLTVALMISEAGRSTDVKTCASGI